ncbi:Protocatechuate 4,5-dioxygenase beta chain (EC 1.13.11.8) [Azospirillum endophyticum]
MFVAGESRCPKDLKVVVLGAGGLPHQLDGERAGFIDKDINKDFDLMCLEKIVDAPGKTVSKIHRNCHIPIPDTGTGLLILQSAA